MGDMSQNNISDLNVEKDTNKLTILRDKIEKFDKNQKIQILKILKEHKIPINENKNGVFINLTNVKSESINALEEYILHIKNQEELLLENEKVKNNYKQTFFDKDNKDTLQNTVNAGEI